MRIRLTIFNKGLILVSVPLLFQLLFVGFLFWMQQADAEAERWVEHSQEVMAQTQLILEGMLNVETGMRGYVITEIPSFTEPFDQAAPTMPETLHRLEALVGDNPDQEARAKVIAVKVHESLDWATVTRRLVEDGKRDRAIERVKTGAGKLRMDDLRAEIAVFQKEEQRLAAAQKADLQRIHEWYSWLLIGGAVASVGISVLLVVAFDRGIRKRLNTLTDNAGRLARGKELAPPVGGSDEITVVDEVFHDMALKLARIQQTLSEKSQILQSVLDSMGDGVVTADENGKFTLFNTAAERMLGIGATDAPPEAWTSHYGVFHADGVTPFPTDELPLVRAMRGEDVDGLELLVSNEERPEGVWVSFTARPLRDPNGRCCGGVVVLHDISERKRTEEALRESEKRFRALADNISQLAWMTDEQGSIVWYNKRWFDYTGTTLEEMQGWGWRKVHAPDHVARVVEKISRCFETGEIWEDTFPLRGVDGTYRWFLSRAVPISNEQGKVVRWFGTNTDITELKQAEDAIRRLNEDLEQRVQERTAELEMANLELAQKNQENEMFVYSVSHDLRSPLVNLQGFSKEITLVCQDFRTLLTDDGVPAATRERGLALVDGDMAEATRFIQTGVMRLSSIIDALLRLSRAGRVEYRWQSVDLNPLVQRIVDSMQCTIAERGATITVKDLPPTWGDSAAIEQVFANLIGNALNYLDPKRPGAIEVGNTDGAVTTRAGTTVSGSTYYVKDNGLGIPEAHMAKVFQMFQRLHADVAKGEGIGLAIVRRAVQRHGGKVWVEPTAGAGSTFFVTLPTQQINGST